MAARDDYPNLARFEVGQPYDLIAARTEWHQMCAEVRSYGVEPTEPAVRLGRSLGIEGTN